MKLHLKYKTIATLAITAILGQIIAACSPSESQKTSLTSTAPPPESIKQQRNNESPEVFLQPEALSKPPIPNQTTSSLNLPSAKLNAVILHDSSNSIVTRSRSAQQNLSSNSLNTSTPNSSIPIDTETDEDTKAEEYQKLKENPFKIVQTNPLSTFSIDVDVASYSNIRRFLNNHQFPPADAVRIEELINYFNYDYPQPQNNQPFSITTEISQTPWNPQHKLVHIGLQGKKIATENLPPSNLVFLIDVSGSMSRQNKLPLLKSAFRLLVNELRPQDRVAIVVYSGAAGVVLPSTPGNEKDKILNAIENLKAGGSTAGGAGIKKAYQVAKENFQSNGNNRVILATDGDFNVGVSSDNALVKLIEEKRDDEVFLTVLGFGSGNLKDAKMEKLANKGNGNYAYIDNTLEAEKVLVEEMGGTLFTIAKDVKIQVEFNPAKVKAYRLIGYENRLLQAKDFNDDTKDAGELGAGHTVTALYEIIPVGAETEVNLPTIDALKYQQNSPNSTAYNSNELMQVKLRYKQPKASVSQLITQPVIDSNTRLNATSNNFRFSAAVASFGMLLRDSEYIGNASFDSVLNLAKSAQGADLNSYRHEFIRLVKTAKFIEEKNN